MSRRVVEKKVEVTLCEQPVPIMIEEIPVTEKADYLERIDRLWDLKQAKQYQTVIVYGDREHFSNVQYFTGYDPRFEETLLILERNKIPVLLVGNEGIGYAGKIPYDCKVILYQPFGLMGQPNDDSELLADILRRNISHHADVGLIGWKSYHEEQFTFGHSVTDVPGYLVETLAEVVGRDSIFNAADLLMDNEYGLRHQVTAKEIVQFELAGTKISRSVYKALKGLREGMNEIEASCLLHLDGEPLCTHPNINFGDAHVSLGLNSPQYHSKLTFGEPAGIGYGLRGSLIHKSGMYIRNEEDLPKEKRHYMEEVVKPYFLSIVKWYEMMHIGVSFGDIYEMVSKELDFCKYHIMLNPGHLIHTDEWSNSPFAKGNQTKVRSGMMIQCDYTVSLNDPYLPCHVEDGLAIGNEALQKEIKELSPSCYKRIQKRREFMKDILHIALPEEVLPLSDLPAVCFPYMADTSVILAME